MHDNFSVVLQKKPSLLITSNKLFMCFIPTLLSFGCNREMLDYLFLSCNNTSMTFSATTCILCVSIRLELLTLVHSSMRTIWACGIPLLMYSKDVFDTPEWMIHCAAVFTSDAASESDTFWRLGRIIHLCDTLCTFEFLFFWVSLHGWDDGGRTFLCAWHRIL